MILSSFTEFHHFRTGICPACGGSFSLEPDSVNGQVIYCYLCLALLQIIEANPVVLIHLMPESFLFQEETEVENQEEDEIEEPEWDEQDRNHLDDEANSAGDDVDFNFHNLGIISS